MFGGEEIGLQTQKKIKGLERGKIKKERKKERKGKERKRKKETRCFF
jgi:hypothetical protein